MHFKIEDDVPLPKEKPYKGFGKSRSLYPFAEMKVGQSVLFPNEKNGGKVHSYAMHVSKVYDVEFKSNLEPGGLRIWRLA